MYVVYNEGELIDDFDSESQALEFILDHAFEDCWYRPFNILLSDGNYVGTVYYANVEQIKSFEAELRYVSAYGVLRRFAVKYILDEEGTYVKTNVVELQGI